MARAKKPINWAKEVPSFIGLVFLIFAFRSTFFEPFRIPSGSMIPTLMIGDFILVNKFAYGFKVPYSDLIGDPIYITGPSKPKRGDVIVFKYPKDPSFNYIKRVVGLPGDEIEMIDKQVYINGKPLEMKPIDGSKIMADMDDRFKDVDFEFYESKTGDATHVIQLDQDNQFNTNYRSTTIPEGFYFAMGDNRDFSSDSRYWGFVPFENIKGKAILVWLSVILPFDEENTAKFRYWRIGESID